MKRHSPGMESTWFPWSIMKRFVIKLRARGGYLLAMLGEKLWKILSAVIVALAYALYLFLLEPMDFSLDLPW